MKPKPGEGFTPLRFAMLGAGDKVEHRQKWLATAGQHVEFVTVLGQHRLAGVYDIEPGVACQQLAQHLGLLLEALARLAALQKPFQPRRAIQALARAFEAFEVVEQGDGIFQARCVVELQQRLPVHGQASPFHMACGAGAMRDLPETDVTREGA